MPLVRLVGDCALAARPPGSIAQLGGHRPGAPPGKSCRLVDRSGDGDARVR